MLLDCLIVVGCLLSGCWLCRLVVSNLLSLRRYELYRRYHEMACLVWLGFSFVVLSFCRFLSSFQKIDFEKLPHFNNLRIFNPSHISKTSNELYHTPVQLIYCTVPPTKAHTKKDRSQHQIILPI
jgi:hypothetical protein